MIKYLKHEEINFKLWDNCIENSINGYIYAYSWYLNIVAGEWDALVEDNYVRVFPLPFRKKFGIKYIYQPPFTQQLGLFSTTLQGFTKVHEFILDIPKEFKLVEINLNKYYKSRDRKGYTLIENTNLELELTADYKTIFSRFSTNLKRNIKKAQKYDLQINRHVNPEEIIALFKANKGEELQVYNNDDYVKLGRLIYMLLHKGRAVIYGAMSQENNLLAAALFLRDKHRFIFLFSGLSQEGKEKAAMPFLINKFVKQNSQSQMILDFEGSNNPSLSRFYKSFGSSEFKYYGLRYYRFPFPINDLVKVFKKMRK